MEFKKNNYLNGGHIGDPFVALYVDSLVREDLPPLPGDVLEHVEACAECKDKILDLFLFFKNSDSPEAAPTRGKVMEMPSVPNRRFYSRKIAAVFFMCAFIFIGYFLIYKTDFFNERHLPTVSENSARHHAAQKTVAPGGESAGKKIESQKEDESAETGKRASQKVPPDFRVNHNLENMIGSQSRSANVRIFSPRNNIYLTKNILFSWEEIRNKPLQLKILNNRNEVFFEYTAKDNRVLFKERLAPGLYYWKLESKNDLLYVGKFFVK